MSVYTVSYQYIYSYKEVNPDEGAEMNLAPNLGVWTDKSKALIASINYNLKTDYEYDERSYVQKPHPIYLNESSNTLSIEELEKIHEHTVEKLTQIENGSDVIRYTRVIEYEIQ